MYFRTSLNLAPVSCSVPELIFVIIRCETQYQQQCSTDTQEECWQETEEECSQEQECEEAPASQHSSSASSGGHKSRSKRGILKKIAHKAGPLLPLAAFNPLGPLLAKKALPLALAPNPLALAGKKLGLKAGALKAQQLSSGGGSSSGSGHSSSSSGHSSGRTLCRWHLFNDANEYVFFRSRLWLPAEVQRGDELP